MKNAILRALTKSTPEEVSSSTCTPEGGAPEVHPPERYQLEVETYAVESIPFQAIKGAAAAKLTLERAMHSELVGKQTRDGVLLGGLFQAFRCLVEGTPAPAPAKPESEPTPPPKLTEHQLRVRAAVHTLAFRHQKEGLFDHLQRDVSKVIFGWSAEEQQMLLAVAEDEAADRELTRALDARGLRRRSDLIGDHRRLEEARQAELDHQRAVETATATLLAAGVAEAKLRAMVDEDILGEVERLKELGLVAPDA